MNLAVVGASGLVGRVMLEVLEERNFDIKQLFLCASNKSVGKEILFRNKKYKILSLEELLTKKIDIALFSAGGEFSKNNANLFAQKGTYVIDNSSAWRMDNKKKLVVPEINANRLEREDKIIANPNCSTIQLVMAIAPLHKKYKIKRMVVSTYQSVTGTGAKAIQQLDGETYNKDHQKVYPYKIYNNVLPHCDVFMDNGYTKEEMKIINETQKILDDYKIKITSTAVRVPVKGGHSESVNISFENEFEIDEIRDLLSNTKGIKLEDDIDKNIYPMPINAFGNDNVFVGRIRKDHSQDKSINMWIVADNLRKGAATNSFQIAEYLVNNYFI